MDNLDDILRGVNKTKEIMIKRASVRRIYYRGEEIITIYPDDKKAVFSGEHQKRILDTGIFRPLIDYFRREGYDLNLDIQ